MESKPIALTGTPPRLINSVVGGFNTAASHIELILIPLLVDIFMWFGPHLRIKQIMQPFLTEWIDTVNSVGTADMRQLVVSNQSLFQEALTQFNLASVFRTWPVGVPSLMAPMGAMNTPMGTAPVNEIPSLSSALLVWLGIIAAGLVLGSLYYSAVAFFAADVRQHPSIRRAFWDVGQTIILTFILLVGMIAILIPATLIMTVFSMISPVIAQFVLLIVTFILLWALLPLVFSTHGIYAYGQSAIASLMTSTRLVRNFLPGTGMFLVILIVLNEGLGVLWRAAPSNSWMLLVGIAGHAFVTTALLASSFIYYQGGMRWMQENLQKIVPAARKA